MQQLAPALTPRSQRRQQKVQDILDAAMALVIDRGIESLTIQALAHDTNCTPGALYRYFGSKDEILAALDVQVLEHFARIFDRSLALGREALTASPSLPSPPPSSPSSSSATSIASLLTFNLANFISFAYL